MGLHGIAWDCMGPCLIVQRAWNKTMHLVERDWLKNINLNVHSKVQESNSD